MATRARLAIVPALGLAALALAGPPSASAAKVESVLETGATFAVAGEPSNGGASLGLSFMWPLEEHFRVGVMGFADELGDATQRLIGPGGVDLGPVSAGTRYTWGGAVRLEAHARSARTLDPFALMTWGLYEVHDDLRGTSIGSDTAAGLGLGAGLLRAINPQHSLGVVVRGQWLSRGDAQRYLSGALEWRWGWNGAGPATPHGAGTTSPR